MPNKKKKYSARFPPARIKKIMQKDDEVGKVAAAVPVIISRSLELFVESLIKKTNDLVMSKNARTLTPQHIKQTVLVEKEFSFLQELVSTVPDVQVTDEEPQTSQAPPIGVPADQTPTPKPPPSGKPRGRPKKIKLEQKDFDKQSTKKIKMAAPGTRESEESSSEEEGEASKGEQRGQVEGIQLLVPKFQSNNSFSSTSPSSSLITPASHPDTSLKIADALLALNNFENQQINNHNMTHGNLATNSQPSNLVLPIKLLTQISGNPSDEALDLSTSSPSIPLSNKPSTPLKPSEGPFNSKHLPPSPGQLKSLIITDPYKLNIPNFTSLHQQQHHVTHQQQQQHHVTQQQQQHHVTQQLHQQILQLQQQQQLSISSQSTPPHTNLSPPLNQGLIQNFGLLTQPQALFLNSNLVAPNDNTSVTTTTSNITLPTTLSHPNKQTLNNSLNANSN